MFKNLILHPNLVKKAICDESLFSKLQSIIDKLKRKKQQLWIPSGLIPELRTDLEQNAKKERLMHLITHTNVLAFLQKDLCSLLKHGWNECLKNILNRLPRSGILVDTFESDLPNQVIIDELFDKEFLLDIDFIDLKSQQNEIREELEHLLFKVLYSCRFILGEEIEILEKKLSEFVGVKHCITVSSGTDALLFSLMAYGVGKGDVILTTPFTFISTAETIAFLGATPVFVDIDPKTFNIDPVKLKQTIDSFLHKRYDIPLPRSVDLDSLSLKGIISVDLFGIPADYDKIGEIAKEYNLFLIEDAAQSFGATYKGKRACSLGDIGCTSFFPAKPFGAYGDGGAIFLNNDRLADTIRSIRVHGYGDHRYKHVRIGANGRFDTLQAAVLLAKIEHFQKELELREKVADYYSNKLSSDLIKTPEVPKNCTSSWAQYSILLKSSELRERIIKTFNEKKIPYGIYYPIPLHLQPVFKYLGYKEGDFPVSEDCAKKILSLPLSPYITCEEQDTIIRAVLSSL